MDDKNEKKMAEKFYKEEIVNERRSNEMCCRENTMRRKLSDWLKVEKVKEK